MPPKRIRALSVSERKTLGDATGVTVDGDDSRPVNRPRQEPVYDLVPTGPRLLEVLKQLLNGRSDGRGLPVVDILKIIKEFCDVFLHGDFHTREVSVSQARLESIRGGGALSRDGNSFVYMIPPGDSVCSVPLNEKGLAENTDPLIGDVRTLPPARVAYFGAVVRSHFSEIMKHASGGYVVIIRNIVHLVDVVCETGVSTRSLFPLRFCEWPLEAVVVMKDDLYCVFSRGNFVRYSLVDGKSYTVFGSPGVMPLNMNGVFAMGDRVVAWYATTDRTEWWFVSSENKDRFEDTPLISHEQRMVYDCVGTSTGWILCLSMSDPPGFACVNTNTFDRNAPFTYSPSSVVPADLGTSEICMFVDEISRTVTFVCTSGGPGFDYSIRFHTLKLSPEMCARPKCHCGGANCQ